VFDAYKLNYNRTGDVIASIALMDPPLLGKTRKPSYRKNDCAMRPMYGCPENFRESLTTPTANFPEIFNGLLFRLSL